MNKLHFVQVIHSHQPVGNFDSVFRTACQNAYLPFLRLLREFDKFNKKTSESEKALAASI